MADWTELEFVRNHIAEAGRYVGEAFADHQSRWFRYAGIPESPLEVVFQLWWQALEAAGSIYGAYVELRAQCEVECKSNKKKYRVDFMLQPNAEISARAKVVGLPIQLIAVELDGHDFHERTKEQVTHRNERDRALQADGWIVLHYSGSELHREPWKCVDDAFGHGYKAFGGMLFEQRLLEAEWEAVQRAGQQQTEVAMTPEN